MLITAKTYRPILLKNLYFRKLISVFYGFLFEWSHVNVLAFRGVKSPLKQSAVSV